MTATQILFTPVEGAVLDLQSLSAVADAPERILQSWLAAAWPDATGLVLRGLELDLPLSAGVLGAVRPSATQTQVLVQPGAALVREAETGRLVLVEVPEPVAVRLPRREDLQVRGGGTLALAASLSRGVLADEAGTPLSSAHGVLKTTLGVVPRAEAARPHLLPLAQTVDGSQDWATDLRRVRQPDSPQVAALIQYLESLVDMIWKAEAEGRAWDRAIYGKNWVRHQTVACAALEGARASLASRPTTSLDRARCLGALLRRLQDSVERAAEHLVQAIGGATAVSPYRELVARPRREES